jgi:hypothetical protein
LADPSELPYASYFANLVVVCGDAMGLSGEELYRVLRPCGGVMCFEGVDRTILPGLLEQVKDRGKNSFAVSTVATVARPWGIAGPPSGDGSYKCGSGFSRGPHVPPEEIESRAGAKVVVRGKLPGAFDWDSETTCDQRVKWPLELLWFGGPGPAPSIPR